MLIYEALMAAGEENDPIGVQDLWQGTCVQIWYFATPFLPLSFSIATHLPENL